MIRLLVIFISIAAFFLGLEGALHALNIPHIEGGFDIFWTSWQQMRGRYARF